MIAAILILLVSFATPTCEEPRVEAPPAAVVGDCKQCANTGEVKCNSCTKSTCNWSGDQRVYSDQETLVIKAHFCSKATVCSKCLGTRLVACPFCKRGLSAASTKLRAENEAWIAQMKKIDDVVGSKPLHAESLHFSVTWGIDADIAYEKRGAPPHAYMHGCLDRLERIYAECLHDFSATDKDFCGKTSVMLWQKVEDQERASLAFTGKSSSNESILLGKSPVISILYDKKQMRNDVGLDQAVTHDVAHCLLSSVFDGIAPGDIKGGWLECGLAFAYEMRYHEFVEHRCDIEPAETQSHQFGAWDYNVVTALLRGKETRYLDVIERNTRDLSPDAQMYAWSYCDFLLRKYTAKFSAIVKGVKAQEPCADLLKRVLDMTPEQFQESWAAWVKEKYNRSGGRG